MSVAGVVVLRGKKNPPDRRRRDASGDGAGRRRSGQAGRGYRQGQEGEWRGRARDVRIPEAAQQVLVADAASLAHAQAEATAATVASVVSKFNFTHVLAASDSRGKNFLPRTAALLDVDALSDITAVVSEDTFVRPIYAGNALATVQSLDKVRGGGAKTDNCSLTIRCR